MQVAIDTWKEIQLSKLQDDLNSKSLAITTAQAQGKAGRQQLALETKNFKKASDDDKLGQFKTLLKSYQSEIDNVTLRARNAETFFLDLYQKISVAPDPVPLIENAMHQSSKLKDYNQLKEETQKLKTQLDSYDPQIIIDLESANSTLKQRLLKYEVMLDEMVKDQVSKKETELRQIMEERTTLYKESEYALQRQLNHLKNEISNLQSFNQSAQDKIFSSNQVKEEKISGHHAELDMLTLDLERAQFKIAQLEHANDILSQSTDESKGRHYQSEINELNVKIRELESIMNNSEEDSKNKRDLLNTEISKRDAQLQNTKEVIIQLESKIKSMQDYQKIKKELQIFKDIEFNGVPTDGDETSIEKMLQNKNKKQETEMTILKAELKDKNDICSRLEIEISNLKTQTIQQTSLIEKLEKDLEHMNESEKTQGSSNNVLETLISGGSSDPKTTQASDIIPILTSQRDRYRLKAENLEEENRRNLQSIYQLEFGINSLKADNIKLYEKLKYVESFKSSELRRQSSFGINIEQDSEFTQKYQSLYENTLDPFKRFHNQEQVRSIKSLNPAERIALNMTRIIVLNKYARWVFIGYLGALHLLVFTTMFQAADFHHELSKSNAHLN